MRFPLARPVPSSPRAAAGRAAGSRVLCLVVLGLGALGGACFAPPAGPEQNVLRVGIDAAPSHLDPRLALDQASTRACELLYDGLVSRDEDLEIVPALAESWSVTEDGRTLRFRLREGVVFHDGSELDSADVAATFAGMMDPSPESPFAVKAGDLESIERVETPGPREVVLHLSQPDAPLLANLCFVPVLPGGGDERLDVAPVGTGPFRFAGHEPGLELRLVRNESYFRGAPHLAGITLRVLRDPSSRVSALRAGEIDLVINDLPPRLVEIFEVDDAFRVIERPGVSYAYLAFNLQDPILSDVRVRQAIAHAVDRTALVEHLFQGRAEPATSLLPASSWAHADGLPAFDHDPAAARALLDRAGHPDPPGPEPRFGLVFKTSNAHVARAQAEILASDLAAVGIDVEVRSHEWGTYYADLRAGRFQLTAGRWIGLADPDAYRLRFHSRERPEDGGLNRGRYANAEVDALVEKGRRVVDPRGRRAAYVRVQEILARELPYVSLYHLHVVAVARAELRDVVLNPAGDFALLRHARYRSETVSLSGAGLVPTMRKPAPRGPREAPCDSPNRVCRTAASLHPTWRRWRSSSATGSPTGAGS